MIVSLVIPTYGRDAVLGETVATLLRLTPPTDELLVVDQTAEHESATRDRLAEWDRAGAIRWLRLAQPSITAAMNRGLAEARGEIVLFLDDDIIPAPNLIEGHRRAYAQHPEAWAVAGRVLQPEDGDENAETLNTEMLKSERARTITRLPDAGKVRGEKRKSGRSFSVLREDLDFRFNSTAPAWVSNVMAGNLSVRRDRALAVGGFDENFIPPVSYRFETEFAKRLVAAGGRIRFEPAAAIRHLRTARGGTRSVGSHLTSSSPLHGQGDYYYALLCGRGWDRARYILRRPFREVSTRFHLQHPWWIPIKFLGELRALALACRRYRARNGRGGRAA